MADISTFIVRINRRAEQAGKAGPEMAQLAALAIDTEVVIGTPVDTGQARSNWLVALGKAATRKIRPYAPGKKLGRGESANAAAAIAQAKGVISGHKPGQDIHISNNLRYIFDLNSGKSPQAAAHFIERAIQRGIQAAKGVRAFK